MDSQLKDLNWEFFKYTLNRRSKGATFAKPSMIENLCVIKANKIVKKHAELMRPDSFNIDWGLYYKCGHTHKYKLRAWLCQMLR